MDELAKAFDFKGALTPSSRRLCLRRLLDRYRLASAYLFSHWWWDGFLSKTETVGARRLDGVGRGGLARAHAPNLASRAAALMVTC